MQVNKSSLDKHIMLRPYTYILSSQPYTFILFMVECPHSYPGTWDSSSNIQYLAAESSPMQISVLNQIINEIKLIAYFWYCTISLKCLISLGQKYLRKVTDSSFQHYVNNCNKSMLITSQNLTESLTPVSYVTVDLPFCYIRATSHHCYL